jgi:hypothetical protein
MDASPKPVRRRSSADYQSGKQAEIASRVAANYILRLLGQVLTVSLETVKVVKAMSQPGWTPLPP